MSTIKLLPDELINKIAAGEVVERPASILKELIENAIDAGADDISVEIGEGGKDLIVVSDNGAGMSADDAELALMRHATSKISNESDLFSITTMGFRGEALASIAAVTRLNLITANSDDAVSIEFDSRGRLFRTATSRSRGTTIICKDLFYNTPARLKFLKASSYETTHCVDVVQSFALAYPKIHFRLVQSGKELLDCHAVLSAEDLGVEDTMRRRCEQVFGAEAADQLIFISKSSEFGKVIGLISPPGVEKSTAKYMFTYLNGRLVRDKILRIAIQRGYHSHLLKGRYPFVILRFESDPALVDVNVHPAKTEVRFQYPAEVQGLIAIAIREGIRGGSWASTFPETSPSTELSTSTMPVMRSSFAGSTFSASAHSSRSSAPTIRTQNFNFSKSEPSYVPSSSQRPIFDEFSQDAQDEGPKDSVSWDQLTYLGAVAKCFLLFSSSDKLLVVDQHAFHERILYERLMENSKTQTLKQTLLIPENIQLTKIEVETLKTHQKKMDRLGFAYDVISDEEIELKSVPHLLEKASFELLLQKIAEIFENEASSENIHDEMFHLIYATMACHAAVRGGDEMNGDDLRILLSQADKVDFSQNCPHGRPVFKWFSKEQMGKWFER